MNSYNGITPTGYRVLIETDVVPEEITESGIIIPQAELEKYQNAQPTGVIRAIGPECWNKSDQNDWAKVGDRVVFDKYSGMLINDEEGTEFRLVNDTGVIALVADGIKLGQLERRNPYER